jgi:Tol biopolymer transport system component
VRGKTLFAVPFDLKRMEVTGAETPVAEGVFYNSIGGFADYAFSDSGLLAYVAGTPAEASGRILEWVDLKGAEQPLPASPQTYRDVRLSPDGQRAALAFSSRTGGNLDIWISDLARGTLTRLTSQGFNDGPVWTPDSRRVVFRASPSGMYWTPTDGSGKPELLLNEPVAIPDSWTPDGKMLLYTDISGGKSHIWVLPAPGSGGGKPHPLFGESAFNESDARVSPDGRWVAYASDESGKNQVYLRPYPGPGGITTVSIDGGQRPTWSHDGREFFFVDGGTHQLMVVDIETSPALRLSRPRALFDSRNMTVGDLTPDGKRFLVAKTPEAAAKDGGDVKLQVVENWFEELRRKAPKGKK